MTTVTLNMATGSILSLDDGSLLIISRPARNCGVDEMLEQLNGLPDDVGFFLKRGALAYGVFRLVDGLSTKGFEVIVAKGATLYAVADQRPREIHHSHASDRIHDRVTRDRDTNVFGHLLRSLTGRFADQKATLRQGRMESESP